MSSYSRIPSRKNAIKKISTSLNDTQLEAFKELSAFADDVIALAQSNSQQKIVFTGADFRGLLEGWIAEINKYRPTFEALGKQKGGDPNIYWQAIDILTVDLMYMLNYKNSELTLYFVAAAGELWDGLANIVSQFGTIFHGQYNEKSKKQQIESEIEKVLSGFSINRPDIQVSDQRRQGQQRQQGQQGQQIPQSRIDEIRKKVMSNASQFPVAQVDHNRFNLKGGQGREVIGVADRQVDRRFTPMERTFVQDSDDDKAEAVARYLKQDYVTPMDDRKRTIEINHMTMSKKEIEEARANARRLGLSVTERHVGSQHREFEKKKVEKDNQPSGGGYNPNKKLDKEEMKKAITKAMASKTWQRYAEDFLSDMVKHSKEIKDYSKDLLDNIVDMANAINSAGEAIDSDDEMSSEENERMNERIVKTKLKDAVGIGNKAKDNVENINRIRDMLSDNKSHFAKVFFNNPEPLVKNPFSNKDDWGFGNKDNVANYILKMVTKNEEQLYEFLSSDAYEDLISLAEIAYKHFSNFYDEIEAVRKKHYLQWNQFKKYTDGATNAIYDAKHKEFNNKLDKQSSWGKWIWKWLFEKYNGDLTYLRKYLKVDSSNSELKKHGIHIGKIKSFEELHGNGQLLATKTFPLRYVRYLALKYAQDIYQEILEDA